MLRHDRRSLGGFAARFHRSPPTPHVRSYTRLAAGRGVLPLSLLFPSILPFVPRKATLLVVRTSLVEGTHRGTMHHLGQRGVDVHRLLEVAHGR